VFCCDRRVTVGDAACDWEKEMVEEQEIREAKAVEREGEGARGGE